MPIMNIIEDMTFTTFFAASSTAPYIRYTTADKMMIKHQGMLFFLLKLEKKASAARHLGNTELDDTKLSIFS